jgi:cyclopropane fatty-acyl-phospholipid synthase-like methyltransferase
MIRSRAKTPRARPPRMVVLGALTTTLILTAHARPVQAPAPAPERTPARVMSYHGAAWLEREGREEEQKPAAVIQTMGLRDGDVVADVGCGTGFFARRMARAVAPHGTVYGVDIQPEMLDLMKEYTAKEGIANVVPVLGLEDDPRLPPGSLDWIILVDVYHEFQKPKPMLAKMRDALKAEGRVALIEYRQEGKTALHIDPLHRMSAEQVLAEWTPAGFALVGQHEFLPTQHFFVFRKAAAAAH